MGEPGALRETYVAAIRHDLGDLTGEEHLAGVVRRPTPWCYAAIDENYPALGPPEDLLAETKAAEERFSEAGHDDAAAVEAAWDAVDFAERYRRYASSTEAVDSAIRSLRERLETGRDVVLVCYEADDKPCHRHLLLELLHERLPATDS